MANITKDEIQEIILNAPEDTTPEEIVAGLIERGHTLEGYEEVPTLIPTKKPTLEKVSRFLDVVFGGGKIGEAIGAGIAKLTVPKEQREFISSPSAKEVLGDIGQVGLTVAGLKGVGTAGRLGARALKTGVLGAGFAGAAAIKEGEEITPGTLAGGAAVGATIPVIGKGLAMAGHTLTEFLPKRLIQSAIGQSKAELLAGKDVSEFVLKKRRIGTPDQLISKGLEQIQNLGTAIQNKLSSAPQTTRILLNEVYSDVADFVNSQGGAISTKEVAEIVNQLAPQAKGLLTKQSMSLIESNRLRQAIDKTLGDRAFLAGQLPFNKSVLRTFANALREKTKSLAPEGTRELFSELSKEITLRDALMETYTGKARNQVINAFDLILAGGGFLGGGVPGGLGAFAIKKGVQSTFGKTFTAVQLTRAQEVLEPIMKGISTPTKTAILKAVAELLASP